ncbi:MAG: MFS transporter [Myxococcota bacterium]
MTNQNKWSTFGVLAALYVAQGLPFGFFTQALPVLLRSRGVSLEGIGFASALAMPWALKILWSPWVDRGPGRRRRRLVPLQGLTVLTLLGLSLVGDGHLAILLGGVFVLNLLAATQDVATDGLAIDLLPPAARGLGNGIQVAGYRIGMIVGGGAVLALLHRLGFEAAMLTLAGLMALTTIPALLHREAPVTAPPPQTSGWSVLRRRGAARIMTILVVFKAGDGMATAMLRPLLFDRGVDLETLGVVLGGAAFGAGLLGALVGGAAVPKLGQRRALLLFGAAQAASLLGYVALATTPLSLSKMVVLCSAEHFAGGMATAALFTAMMGWARGPAAASEYTLMSCVVVIASGVAGGVAGFVAESLGYIALFELAAGLGCAAVVLTAALTVRR